jgi:filamentous hemagglutinin family protein
MQPWLRFKDRTMDHSKVGKTHTKMLKQYLVLATTITMVGVAYGNPVLENVSSGNVSVTQSPNTTIVNQTSQQAIINWNSFNIAAGEKTQFVQPNASSVALNRINPAQGASQIYGSLSSNGQIILINGAGIHFGPNAMVNVGGMIASTSDISNANFLAGKYIFDMPSTSGGSIINEGRLTAANYGLIALIGSNVQNTGVIQARLGNVILGSGNKFTLDFYGDQLINFVVDEAASQGGTIKNSGEILADGGSILVTARTAQGVLDDAIDMGGVVQARSVSEKGGVIILSADEGAVNVTGKVIASGKKNGGTIKVLGQEVHLSSSAVLNANGRLGGGEILVGGNAHGAGTEQNAMTTTVDTGALLSANALLQGNGGKVIVWSNNATNFHGSISATGGVLSGNGGFVETSGHYLDVSNAKVNLLAANGTTGNWLLDPADLTICASCTTTASTSGNTFDTNGSNSYLLVSDLTTALSSADITLQTSATDTGGNGDIFVNTAVNWSSANTLTLSAANRIFLNADITANNGGLVLSAANTAQSITSGSEAAPSSTGVIANIAVNKFNLAQGQWYQVSPTLPSFSVGSDFQINSASGAVQFLRAVGGTGDSSSPYQLTDIYGVQGINSSAAMLSANYQLANNIDASGTAGWNNGTGFSPIGNDTTDFSGNFDGQNHTVNNYVSTRNGLFGVTDASATILNVGVTNATLTLSHMSFGNFGLLVGENNGAVNNAYSTGSISNQDSGGGEILGGLVGQNNGSIDTSYSTSTLTNNDTGGYEIVGGLVGLNNNIISGTHSTSIITNNESSGSELLGGLVGQNFGLIDTSYSTGSITNNDTHGSEVFGGLVGQNFYSISMAHSIENVSNNENGTGSENFGGLVGQNYGSIDTVYSNGVITNTDVNGAEAFSILVAYNVGSISNAYSSGRVVNNDSNDGGESFAGLVGLNFGSINSAFNTGTVFNNDVNGHEDFGGLVGVNGGDITDTYNLGNVTNTDTANGQENFAGLVGNNLGGTINNAYDAGTISNNNSMGSELFGPLVGNNSGQVNNAFWDMDTSGANTSTVGTGAHTATLMQQTTFCPSGNCSGNTNYFDFVNIWGVIPGDGINADGSYPYLLSFFTPAPRIISGFIPGGGPTATGLAGNTVELAVGGNNIDSVTTGYNGFYYFLEKSGTVADNTPFITYLSGAANKSNVVSNAPTHGASLALLNMTNNFIQVGGGVENSAGVLTIDPTLSISNSDLGLAATGLSSNDILYSVLGNNLTLSNSSHVNTTLQTDMLGYANTTYNINGTIASNSTETDTLNFYGLVSINTNSVSTSGDQTYHSTITANTDTTINSQNSSLNFADINGQSTAMSLLASNGSITLNGDISTLSNAQNALVLVDGISFINNAGSNALSASNSRYLIYSVNPNTDTLGGLMPTGKRYNTSYANNMPSSLSNQTGNLTLYTFAPVLTITADNVSSVYGADPALTYSVTGFINGDSATGLSGSAILTLPANVADLHVIGSPYTITASDGTLVSNENYGLTFVNGQLTVTPAALTVSAMGQNKVYDATTTANVALTNNGIASDNVSVNYNSADFSDKNAGTNKNISVSGISISGVNSADYILQNTTASTTADITPFALTIGATAQNKVYDSTTQAAVSVSSNSFSGDNINLNYGSAAFNDANAGTAKVVSVNGITLGGSDANNYTVNASTVLTIANITPAALTITANNQSKIYGQTPDLGTSAFTSSGLQGSDNVNSVNLTSSGTNANAQVANGPYAIAASSATGSNFMSSNYNITYADGSLTVTPAALTITANNASKTYGQTASFTGSEFTQSGLQNNESIGGVTLNSAGTSNTANVSGNNPYSITASSATGGSFNATNYTISYVNGGLTVNPATLTYTANASTTTYGTPATSLVGNVTGFVNNETLTTATSGTLGFASSATTNSNVGNYAITGSGLTANNGNYVFTQAVGNASALTINPATLTYAANTNSVTYGSTLPSLSGTVTGFMNGETEATATTGTSAFSSSVTTNSNVGTYAVNGAGLTANNGNYVFTQAAGNATALTINPATLVYTANAGTVTYGSSLLSLSGNVTGFVNGQTLATATTGTTAFSSTATSDSNVGTYAVNGSGLTANNGNYIFTQAASNAAALTINPATLTYTANTGTVTYGSSLIFLSGTVSGFVNGQTQATATTGTTVFSSAATSDSNVGTYAVNGSGLMANNGNYVFTQAASNATALTINPATLTYTANTGTVTYGSDIPSISGAVTGFVNGQTLATATTGNTAFTSSITANSNVGVYAVNGSGLTANNGNYVFTQAASNATALTINPATLTYTANTGTITYGSSLPSLSGAVTGFVNGQTLASATTGTSTFTSPANANSNVGNYAVNGSGLSANNGNYIFTQAASNAAALKITPATLTYAANTNSMTYGSAVPALSGNVTGFVNGQTLATATTGTAAYASPATSSSNVGNYAINGSGLTANNGNYLFVQAAGNATALSILQAQLTIAANNQSKVYGAALPTLTASYTGFVNGDTSANLTTEATLSTTATASSSVASSPYAITASGASAMNYKINYTSGNLTITPASLSVIANNQNINYGQTYSTTAVTYNGFVNGDTVKNLNTTATVSGIPSSDGQFHATNPATSTSTASASPFAPYTLTPSNVSNPNYTVSYVTGNLYVSPVGINFNVPAGSHTVAVNMSAGAPVTISGHSNLSTEQLQFNVDGTTASTSSFLVTDISGATITSHATNTALGTLVGLQVNATDTVAHTLSLSQNVSTINADTTNVVTPDSTFVPVVFGDPTTTLSLLGNGKNNTININSLDSKYTGTLTANTNGGTSDVINLNGLNAATPNTISLIGSTIDLNGDINLPNSTLNLTAASAAVNASSITSSGSSTGVLANINVNNFDLIQGGWYQDNSSLLSLSTFPGALTLNSNHII